MPKPSPRISLTIAAAVLAGCGGGLGDAPSEPLADVLGDGARLTSVGGPATWEDPTNINSEKCASPADKGVYVTGVTIVAIDDFDETGDGQLGNYYVEDTAEEPAPYSGVTVFDPSFSPPDLRLAQGDVVDVNGVYTEFLGPANSEFGQCRTLPEISGTLSFRFDDNRSLPPKTVPIVDLKSYETARPYLGMLVKVEDLKLASKGTNSGGRYTASIDVGGGISQEDVPRISNELFDLEGEGPPLTEGGTFTSVTGILTYFYGFKLAPRSAADFEL